jgi:ribonuclease BN (tRNA processing enzyme)
VETGQSCFAIDLGSGQFLKEEARVRSLSGLLLTHLHDDHISELPSLPKVRKGLPDLTTVSPEPLDAEGVCILTDVPDEWCGLTLEAVLTNHSRDNFAYRLSDEGCTVVWTGDASYSRELAVFCRGADVIVCEATMKEIPPEEAIAIGHMTPSLFARLMNEAMPKLAVATHFCELNPSEFAEEVRSEMDAQVELVTAYDGMVLNLNNFQ